MQKNKKIQFVLPIIRENKSTKKIKIKKPNRLYTKPSQIYIHTYHKKQKSKPNQTNPSQKINSITVANTGTFQFIIQHLPTYCFQ